MKLKLTEQELQKIEITAVQNVMKKKFIEAVEKRMTEIEADLDSINEELTPEQIITRYINISNLTVPTKELILPH